MPNRDEDDEFEMYSELENRRARRRFLPQGRLREIFIFAAVVGTLSLLILVALLLTVNSSPHQKNDSDDTNNTSLPTLPRLAFGTKGAVASENTLCSQMGTDILKEGGNAIDAAVAVSICLGVYQPHNSGIGGGAIITIRMANGTEVVIDSREVAPGASFVEMYNNDTSQSAFGPRAVAVPGELKGLEMAFNRYGSGRVPWKRLFRDSINAARDGFLICETFSEAISKELESSFNIYDEYFVNGRFLRTNDTIKMPKLADTLEAVANNGTWSFYNGDIADDIVRDVQNAGGILTKKDMQEYQPRISVPLRGRYREYEYICPGPPFAGCAIMIETLNILEGYNVTTIDRKNNGPMASHILAESLKFGYANRIGLGDPDFVDVSSLLEAMTSKSHAEQLRARINMNKAYNWTHYEDLVPLAEPSRDNGTMHLSIVDEQRNAVSITSTVNLAFGSGFASKSTGVLLNDQMDDFSVPGTSNTFLLPPSVPNYIKPGKKPMSSMSPTIITKDGQLKMIVGASGGSRIPTSVLQVISAVLDSNMELNEAIWMPRIHAQWLPDRVQVDPNLPQYQPEVFKKLKDVGNTMYIRPTFSSNVQAVVVGTDGLRACSDPRKYADADAY